MSSYPPPCAVGPNVNFLCVPSSGSMMTRFGLPSSFWSAQSWPVPGLALRPSLWPLTLNVLTTWPSMVYSTMVLLLPSVPSVATSFPYPIKTWPPMTAIESGFVYESGTLLAKTEIVYGVDAVGPAAAAGVGRILTSQTMVSATIDNVRRAFPAVCNDFMTGFSLGNGVGTRGTRTDACHWRKYPGS